MEMCEVFAGADLGLGGSAVDMNEILLTMVEKSIQQQGVGKKKKQVNESLASL